MLCVVGDLVEDVVAQPGGPLQRGTDSAARIVRRRGGSAANVAVAAAAAGCPTRFIGRVGDDALADQLVEELLDAEVDARVQRSRGRTGSIVVLVESDGERTMLPDRASAVELTDVDPAWLDGVTWLHVPAYSLCVEPIGSASLALVRQVRARWGRVSVDVSSVGVARTYGVAALGDLLRDVAPDVVFANRDEVEVVAGMAVPLLVIKRGAEPVELVHDGRQRTSVPVDAVDVVRDTTGAGDAFAGGFLAATVRGASPVEAARAGAAAAAAVLRLHAVE